jgi:hypothetical protein
VLHWVGRSVIQSLNRTVEHGPTEVHIGKEQTEDNEQSGGGGHGRVKGEQYGQGTVLPITY